MTKMLYLEDQNLQHCMARVVSVNHNLVELDQTVMYPEGGGQPSDRGMLIFGELEYPVKHVKKEQGRILHEVEGNVEVGDEVRVQLDWHRRNLLMRSHTAAHIISAVFHLDWGAKITGNQLDVHQSRIDFDLENFDRDAISTIIGKSNDIVKRNLPVDVVMMSREEVEANPSLVKLAMGLPPGLKSIRMIKIGDVDMQPDGGTHVSNTGEVGTIQFLKADNKGASRRRVYFKLDPE